MNCELKKVMNEGKVKSIRISVEVSGNCRWRRNPNDINITHSILKIQLVR